MPFFPSEDAVRRIADGIADRTLPKPEWTHAAHFAAALWFLRRDRAQALPDVIRAYNEATGVANTDSSGYHETITLASLRGARAMLADRPPDMPLHVVLDALLAGPLGRSDWPLAYWSKARLFSVEARRRWVAPEFQPLPWP
jgi:hypothetical protein